MEPDGGGTGSAVEGERQRALRGIGFAELGVGDEEDVGARLALLGFENKIAGRGLIFDDLAADRDLMLGDGENRILLFILILIFLLIFVGGYWW